MTKKTVKKRLNAELRKPDILKSYYEVILKEGIEGASIAKVAKKMKINPSLIIHYFANKDNMTVDLVDYISRKYNSLFLKLVIETDDPGKRLEKLIDVFCSDIWYNNTDISGDFSILTLSFRNKKVFKRIQNLYAEFINLISKELETAMTSGLIESRNPKRLAELLVSLVEGYRHFKHFYIEESESEEYRQDMIKAMKAILNI